MADLRQNSRGFVIQPDIIMPDVQRLFNGLQRLVRRQFDMQVSSQPVQPSLDGNTVEMDVERAQFAENAMRYEAGLTFISGRIKGLLTAIQGQSA